MCMVVSGLTVRKLFEKKNRSNVFFWFDGENLLGVISLEALLAINSKYKWTFWET